MNEFVRNSEAADIQSPEPLDFIEVMKTRAEATRGRPKRARTRAKILAAATAEISAKGYEGLTVDGICTAADMARGTFYLYYSDRSEVAVTVFRMFWTLVYRVRPRLRGYTLVERIRITNNFYLALYARNASLLAGQPALWREREDFARWHDETNHRWAQVIAANMPGDVPRDEKMLRARALVAMADEILSNIFMGRTPALRHWADDPQRLADALSAIWTRVVFDMETGGTQAK